MKFVVVTDWTDDSPYFINISRVTRIKRRPKCKRTELFFVEGDIEYVKEKPTEILSGYIPPDDPNKEAKAQLNMMFDDLESDQLDKLVPIVRERNV